MKTRRHFFQRTDLVDIPGCRSSRKSRRRRISGWRGALRVASRGRGIDKVEWTGRKDEGRETEIECEKERRDERVYRSARDAYEATIGGGAEGGRGKEGGRGGAGRRRAREGGRSGRRGAARR